MRLPDWVKFIGACFAGVLMVAGLLIGMVWFLDQLRGVMLYW